MTNRGAIARAGRLAGVVAEDRRFNCRNWRDGFYRIERAVQGSWSYTASMPLIFGIGLSRLLQWVILPPVMVAAYRTLGPVLFTQSRSQRPMPAHDFTRSQP